MSFLLSSQGLRTHFIALHFPARHMDFRQTLVYGVDYWLYDSRGRCGLIISMQMLHSVHSLWSGSQLYILMLTLGTFKKCFGLLAPGVQI